MKKIFLTLITIIIVLQLSLYSQDVAVIGNYNPSADIITSTKTQTFLNLALSNFEKLPVVNAEIVKSDDSKEFYLYYTLIYSPKEMSHVLIKLIKNEDNSLSISKEIEQRIECKPQGCTSCGKVNYTSGKPICRSCDDRSGFCNMINSMFVKAEGLVLDLLKKE